MEKWAVRAVNGALYGMGMVCLLALPPKGDLFWVHCLLGVCLLFCLCLQWVLEKHFKK